MGKPQIIKTPSGDELVVLPCHEYEDLVDALAVRKVEAALAEGRDELLSSDEATALLAAPTPLAFWRQKRGKTPAQLAAEVGVSPDFLADLEAGNAKAEIGIYAKLAQALNLLIDDLVDEDENSHQ